MAVWLADLSDSLLGAKSVDQSVDPLAVPMVVQLVVDLAVLLVVLWVAQKVVHLAGQSVVHLVAH